MPVNCNAVLNKMISAAPNKAANIDQSISQIEDIQGDLTEEAAAIRECVTDKARDELRAYLEGPKLAEIQILFPSSPILSDAYLVVGPTYGTIDFATGNITDWEYRQDIIPTPIPPLPSYITVYSYVPGLDPIIDKYVSDYAFGNDYITHPVGIGAAYGLEPLVDMYEQGKATLLGNKNKIVQSVNILKGYLS